MIGFRETTLDELSIDHEIQVSTLTGSARLTVPIRTTPGRESFGPELALGYGSGEGNSTFGVGWFLGGVPSIEVGCVKDFPGSWAEYQVYDGGILQIVHRISSPEALTWSEQCRTLYSDFGLDYTVYAMGRLEDRCLFIAYR